METTIECPKCQHSFIILFSEYDKEGDIDCPQCGVHIHIDNEAVITSPLARPKTLSHSTKASNNHQGLVVLKPVHPQDQTPHQAQAPQAPVVPKWYKTLTIMGPLCALLLLLGGGSVYWIINNKTITTETNTHQVEVIAEEAPLEIPPVKPPVPKPVVKEKSVDVPEGKSWLAAAEKVAAKKDYFAAALMAGKAIGYSGFGRAQEMVDDPKFGEKHPAYITETDHIDLYREITDKIKFYQTKYTPVIWSSQNNANHSSDVNCVAYSPDGKHIVSGAGITLRIWDTETGQPIGEPLEGHSSSVSSVAYSPDGKRIVSGGLDNTLRIWDAETGKQIGEPLKRHSSRVQSVAYSPDGKRIVSAGYDNTLRIWDAETGKQIGEAIKGAFISVVSGFCSVAYSFDGKRIVSGSFDNTLRIWDAETGKQRGESIKMHSYPVWSVAYSPDGKRIVSGSWDKTLRIWDAETVSPIGESLKGHSSEVNSVAYSPDGKRIVSGSSDKTLRIWDAEMGQPISEPLKGHSSGVKSVSYSPDGKHIVSGSSDRTLRIWDVSEKPFSLLAPYLTKGYVKLSKQGMIFLPTQKNDSGFKERPPLPMLKK